ncbi:glycoside hydrolase family 15 protein [Myriangium duriaei CBS 260.36]|uniref:glucan 1,4-alpha-glucosidase n=1 Tax=Myriangium duriaei CBS 260.36 TaxID=1168546 RepID=A0A9P4J8G5_9PEZI|nr:glycoside hydrolase family 15 protein [Myriangium duriaei CBS 260.36]
MCVFKRAIAGIGFAAAINLCSAQQCQPNVVNPTLPTNGQEVVLQSYSYCGGFLNATVYIANLDYDKLVTLYYTTRQNVSTPLSALSLGYISSIPNTTYEYWGSATSIYVDGISELLNLTYQATDIGKTYSQDLNINVVASGAPEPTLPGPPAPYASPSGLQDDITSWLSVGNDTQIGLAKSLMFANINPSLPDVANGTVVAARSGPTYPQQLPDYEYNWVRDASLTFDVVAKLYQVASSSSSKSTYETLLLEYANARAHEQTDPGLQTGLGEPKFYLNNTIFTGPWGRPQNDGPATSALTLIEFATAYLQNGGSIDTVKSEIYDSTNSPNAPVQRDLLFVASNWTSSSFDIWEEESSDHFYDRLVQRKALVQGAAFATLLGDDATSATLTAAVSPLTSSLSQFWDANRQLILYEYGPVLREKTSYKDVAVVLGVIHGYNNDGVFGYSNDEVLASMLSIATSFLSVYPIANITVDQTGGILGIPIGRYPEDVYDGYGTEPNGGNPWYLATAAMAEAFYRAVAELRTKGCVEVTNTSLPFFTYFAPSTQVQAGVTYVPGSPEFDGLTNAVLGWGDAFMRRIKYHAPQGGHLPEEYNRNNGSAQGAADLTWSYAALITAALARGDVSGSSQYAQNLADLPIN